ncbi:hypothetical protein BJ878DRAFT_571030 [Calycina marina]|uniref:Uncharacterized protein n=1 Tax=Calycina marina TaxID=1763456 RepID=A0A9P7YV90_9HELO|nr:hypothetical protein BJ878DRAFT_571030 [Calycina marina]
MLIAAVKALAVKMPALKVPKKGILPDVQDVREVCLAIAVAVEEGLARVDGIPNDQEELSRA